MLWLLIPLALILVVVYEEYSGRREIKRRQAELAMLKSGVHYYQLVKLESRGRKYLARVRRWNVPEEPGKAELWSIEGSNPDGWTQFFFWPHDDLEFI